MKPEEIRKELVSVNTAMDMLRASLSGTAVGLVGSLNCGTRPSIIIEHLKSKVDEYQAAMAGLQKRHDELWASLFPKEEEKPECAQVAQETTKTQE